MVATTDNNPTLLQEQVASILVQPLEAASVVLASGPQIFNTASPLRIPRLKSGATVGWVGEGETIPESGVAFDEVKLMPSDRKSLKVITSVTNELVRQSVIGIDAVLKSRIVTDVASALDDALLNGDGADGSITGLTLQSGVQNAALDVTNADSLLDAIGLAHAAEVTPNRWMLSGADFIALRKIKDTSGKYILEADLTAGATYTLFGIPVVVTNKLAAGTALLLDMNQVAVARDVDPTVTVDASGDYFRTDSQGIRVVTRYDLGLLHPEGVIRLSANGS
ncbi:Major capsid protein HK97 OS=Tsukamurella paurometabola (strain ATCC 8368 / DSM / CCUG 35730/ CIP 100753 / JCM 10117 / KCTC 9821 / NBRC 16120 / NCIMB 702349/ NCTC 13040) OX=521096 GN=Tpau_3898 PE=4 SV=1 [Tsukamurella paurometabola]|uniref:Major capsid protein HK97 n=1 Tax=Tsukamurella paurometabola (strain ATCC 8368 / DSM 20162 / CCUG 35730 / CIP 100753 / JCM 10117 / KCTC 9821 / NBRC 16120 / NCIMB 702349 / NCTC 13040) TaxID=521096 RepID=D5UMJ6_TSUPD|nr:phage major capsid protein [Tsukamurella paurometabola]ADG80470.1 major capsid protein HK97 [Tsukamurella paurometabola DSM 20162]SUP39764.1 Predicted phage phi-C31 gp36 major capsid-like protein [Tsukamurella paurometabola]